MKKLNSIVRENKRLQEAMDVSNAFAGPPASDGSLEYDDIAMTRMDDPRVIAIFNRYLQELARANITSIKEALLRIRNKFMIFGLSFEYGDIDQRIQSMPGETPYEGDTYLFQMKLFGGVFDPYTGVSTTGLEEMCPDGLFLQLVTFGTTYSASLVSGKDVSFKDYDALELQPGFAEKSLGNIRTSNS